MNIHSHLKPNETWDMQMNFVINFIARCPIHQVHMIFFLPFTVYILPANIIVKMSARMPTRTHRDLILFEINYVNC